MRERMIYRILCNSASDVREEPDGTYSAIPEGRLKGAFLAGISGFDLVVPSFDNPRARFYFTEAGWKQVGRIVAANARREGRVVKVIRQKNPHKSQIVYRDELQVAIVPRKETRKR